MQTIMRAPGTVPGVPEGCIPLDGSGHAWIDGEDVVVEVYETDHEGNPVFVVVELEFDDTMERLYEAWRRGQRLVYDGDPDVTIMHPDDGGNPIAEIYWAVRYRGGLEVAE